MNVLYVNALETAMPIYHICDLARCISFFPFLNNEEIYVARVLFSLHVANYRDRFMIQNHFLMSYTKAFASLSRQLYST